MAADSQEPPLVDLGAELESLQQKEGTLSPKPTSPEPAVKTPSVQSGPAQDVTPAEAASETAASTDHPQTVDAEWGYQGANGPDQWGRLSSAYALCGSGRNQSPIDLRDQQAVGTQGLPDLDIVYREVPLKILHTGKTVQVNFPLGSYLQLNRSRYELMHYRFHTPSEHHKEGFAYPLEIQFMHRNGDGHWVNLAVLFQEGEPNPHLARVLSRLPKVEGKAFLHTDVKLNPAYFLPANTEFYKYSGSLTTPPCSEGVNWMVFKQPIEASARQIQQLSSVMGDNARPVQPLFARSVLKSWMEPETERSLYEFY
jgi:carbonic anhydrase